MSEDQTILASDENFGNVAVCPGGVVHVNLVHLSLKFLPEDFVRLSELLSKARLNLEQKPPPRGKPRLQLVSTDASCDPPVKE